MKKLILGAFCILCACSSENTNIPEDDFVPQNLYQLTITRNTTTPNETPTMGWNYIKTTYNPKGKAMYKKEILYIDVFDVETTYQHYYTYDDDNRLIEEKIKETNGQKDEITRISYTYNDFDSIAVKETANPDGLIQTTYEYDKEKRLITEIEKHSYGYDTNQYRHDYFYSKNKTTRITTIHEDGSPFQTQVVEYDSHHNMLKYTFRDDVIGKVTTSRSYEYQYDKKGRITHKSIKNDNSDGITYEKFFYNRDNTIQKVHHSYSNRKYEADMVYEYLYAN